MLSQYLWACVRAGLMLNGKAMNSQKEKRKSCHHWPPTRTCPNYGLSCDVGMHSCFQGQVKLGVSSAPTRLWHLHFCFETLMHLGWSFLVWALVEVSGDLKEANGKKRIATSGVLYYRVPLLIWAMWWVYWPWGGTSGPPPSHWLLGTF